MDWPIEGSVAPGFEPVRVAFEDNFVTGVEVGAGFCALLEGQPVVDLWGGFRDQGRRRAWQADTPVNVYSTGKGLAAAAFATLVDDAMLDYGAPVARHWPQLGTAVQGLDVTGLLSHRAGLCGVREPLSVADLYDWRGMCDRLERTVPFWPPGSAAGYHAVTWGYLAGELARRVSGTSLSELLRTRIAEPLGVHCSFGLPADARSLAADLIGPNRARLALPVAADADPPGPFHQIAMTNPLIRPYADACSDPWRDAELAASNAHASARDLARVYAALAAGGELDGVRILTSATVDKLAEEVWGRQPDLVLGYGMRRGRGVNLNTGGEFGPDRQAFGHTGTGGSLAFADPGRRLGVGYAMNQLWGGTGPGSRGRRLVDALYRCLDSGAGARAEGVKKL